LFLRLVLTHTMTKKVIDIEEARARARAILDKNWLTPEKVKAAAEAEDAAACKKCGRVIYCGVGILCRDPECGLKNGNKKR
jgi:hypothetical protein